MNAPGQRIAVSRISRAAALAIACVLTLGGCSSTSSPASSEGTTAGQDVSPSALPSPSGTWTPPPADASAGPTAPAPVPTETAKLTDPVTFGTDITVSLTKIESITVEGETPGEETGPAVRVTASIKNGSTEAINISSAVVSLTADTGEYGVDTTAGDPQPFQGSVSPGDTAEGTYVFMLDPAKEREVTISVNYAAGEPLAIFTGRTA